jgi:N-acetylglucosaminyldiphosphoundecaprenol N-acetyl-beta-D-mannosaminyltransferase
MTFLKFYNYSIFNGTLNHLTRRIDSACKLKKSNPIIINCLNPHSFIVSLKDYIFRKSILNTNLNLIDGIGIYIYLKFFRKLNRVNRITGYDIFEKLLNKDLKFFFLGGNNRTTTIIREKLKEKKVQTWSPSYSEIFSKKENKSIIKKINKFKPNILFVGLTAPKQEKWSYQNRDKLHCNCIVNIGAVFDYYAGNYFRAPKFFRKIGSEWLFRLLQKPSLWGRTFYSGIIYLFFIIIFQKQNSLYFEIIDNLKKINDIINKKKSFILSAFNLSFFSNIYSGKLKLSKYVVLWADGIFSKILNNNILKIPGYKLISHIKISSKYKSIHIVGNTDAKVNSFIKKKFNDKIIDFSPLPFANIKEICKQVPKIKKNSLVLITLPTPKQEIYAESILKKYPMSKVICIGGGLKIASGSEKKCPKFFDNIGAEFIWRLNSDTKRRSRRLLVDLYYFFKCFIVFDFFLYSYKNEK